MFEIGASLQEARARRGLTPEDVQKAIRIRGRYLTALEEERWELLPGDAYTKGFLRSYAEFLGLNGNLYVDEYNSRSYAHGSPALVPEAMTAIETGRIGFLRPVLAIAAIVGIVAAVAAWQLRGAPAAKPTTPASHPAAQPASQPASMPAATKKDAAAKPRTTPAVLADRAVLVAARGRVWLQVRTGSAHGAVLFEGVLEQGRTLPVNLSPQVWVRVGAPWNLQIRLGGHVLHGLPAQPGNVVVTRSGLA